MTFRFRTETNQKCKKCPENLDKAVDVRSGLNVYVCSNCGAIFERNLGNSANPVGKEVKDARVTKRTQPEEQPEDY